MSAGETELFKFHSWMEKVIACDSVMNISELSVVECLFCFVLGLLFLVVVVVAVCVCVLSLIHI